jgi:RepB DNA-primase from phage plasmid
VSDLKPITPKADVTPSDFIRNNFRPSDRIAVLVRNAKRGEIVQRISTSEKIAATPFQSWMRYKNGKEGCDVYIGMNALKPTAFKRTKEDILAIRHLYVDLDRDGSASLSMIEKSTIVPPPNYVLNTSPDKYQVIWKVEGIELGQAETLLHALAREFNGDHAATDAARVLRIPGYLNKKYEQDFQVSARFDAGYVYGLRDFNLRTEPAGSDHWRVQNAPRRTASTEPRPITQSERDWAHVKNALASGADPEELIGQLAQLRAADKSDPHYYARLTVTKAVADLRRRATHTPTMSEEESHPETER